MRRRSVSRALADTAPWVLLTGAARAAQPNAPSYLAGRDAALHGTASTPAVPWPCRRAFRASPFPGTPPRLSKEGAQTVVAALPGRDGGDSTRSAAIPHG